MCAPKRAWAIALAVQTVLAGLASGGNIARAQTAPTVSDVQAGARVRLQAPTVARGRVIGTVARTEPAAIVVLRDAGGELTVPVAALLEMDVSRGTSSGRGALKGAIWGGGAGLAVGALVAVSTKSEDYYAPMSDGQTVALLTISGAAIGVPIGALIGCERWDRVHLSPQVVVVPLPRGVGVAFSFHFGVPQDRSPWVQP